MGATITALLAREFTGEGQLIDISSQDVLFSFFSGVSFAAYFWRGSDTTRQGDRVGRPYVNGCLRCSDGYVGLRTPQHDQWLRFLELIDSQDGGTQANRGEIQRTGQSAAELETHVSEWLLGHTKEQVFELCRKAHVPCAPVMDAADITRDDHLRTRGYFVDLERSEVGRLTYPGAPVRFSETLWRAERPAPLLGEHNAEIFGRRVGLSGEELVRLQHAGTI
jgi:crotonobetainyl-CoA:carnitine CoA-transferase CaiB-like acyl-CoA transferase